MSPPVAETKYHPYDIFKANFSLDIYNSNSKKT